MNYYRTDISNMVGEFQAENAPSDRYASFDYCYQYFHPTTGNNLLSDIEKSCLAIGFYLASWGMLRGSSFLLSKSVKYYEPLIRYIAGLESSIWNIDVDNYTGDNVRSICTIYQKIQSLVVTNGSSHLTLVTKIMLGVFGFIPAYDNYFGNSFREIFHGACGFRSVNPKSLNCIRRFYDDNRKKIDLYSSQIYVKEFTTGNDSALTYTKSKIIDMYGFTKGLKQAP